MYSPIDVKTARNLTPYLSSTSPHLTDHHTKTSCSTCCRAPPSRKATDVSASAKSVIHAGVACVRSYKVRQTTTYQHDRHRLIPTRKTTRQTMSFSVLSLLLAASLAAAQNSTDLTRCPLSIGELSPNARVNSTGMRSFRWSGDDADWFLTSTFNDTRDPVLVSSRHDSQGYISAPMNSRARVCVFMFDGLNATVAGDSGCDDALSAGCVDFLKREAGFGERCRGPENEDVAAACGRRVAGWAGTCTFPPPRLLHAGLLMCCS